MRSFTTVLILSLLVAGVFSAASSSSAVVTSNKTNTTNTTITNPYSCVLGSDAPCLLIGSNYCCYYSWY